MKIKLLVFLLLITAGKRLCSQPEGRHLEMIAYNEATQTVYLYGGTALQDKNWIEPTNLWIYHKGAWTEVNNNVNPGNRRAQGMLFLKDKLYVYGGARSLTPQRDTALNDLWSWDGKKWEFVVNGPALETPYLVNIKGDLTLCGYPDSDHKDFAIWQFKKNQFKKLFYYKDISIDRGQGPLKVSQKDNQIITANFQGDTLCIYALGEKVKVTYCNPIPNRTRFGFIWQPQHKKYYLFGGRNESGDLNDFWQIDEAGNAQKLAAVNLPEPRSAFSWLTTSTGMLLYGGVLKNGAVLSNELFQYNNSWQKLK